MAIVAFGYSDVDFRVAQWYNGALPMPAPPAQYVYVQAYSYDDNIFDGLQETCRTGVCPVPPDLTIPEGRLFAGALNNQQFESWRTLASSTTCHLSAPAVANQGLVYAFNGPCCSAPGKAYETRNRVTSTGVQPLGGAIPYQGDGVYEAVVPQYMRLPFDEDEMTKMTTNPYVTEATHGVFIISRPCGPETEWVTRHTDYDSIDSLWAEPSPGTLSGWARYSTKQANYAFLEGTTIGIASSQLVAQPLSGVPLVLTRRDGVTIGTDNGPVSGQSVTFVVPWLAQYYGNLTAESPNTSFNSDIGYDQWTAGVILFRGISTTSTIDVKRILSLEARLLTTSPAVPFLSRPPPEDPRALSALRVLARSVPSIYPARDNDLSTILKWVSRILSGGSAVAAVLGTAVPELLPVSAVLSAGSRAASYGSEYFGKSKKSAPQTPRTPRASVQVKRAPVVLRLAKPAKKKPSAKKGSLNKVRQAMSPWGGKPRRRSNW